MIKKTSLIKKINHLLVGCCAFLIHSNTLAEGSPWGSALSGHVLQGQYAQNTSKETTTTVGLDWQVGYLDRYEVTFIGNRTSTHFYDETILLDKSLDQTSIQIDIAKHYFSDFFKGRLTPNVWLMNANGTLSDPVLGDVIAYGGGLNYLSYTQKYAGDFHFARSDYEQDIQATQIDAALGFSLAANWLQMRYYQISETYQDQSYQAIDFLFKHFFGDNAWLDIDSIFVGSVIGDRLYAYDTDSHSLWNVNEKQTMYNRIGVEWHLSNRWDLLMLYGQSEHQNLSTDLAYKLNFAYLNISKAW